MAHTPMSQTRSTPAGSGLPPVPVAIFLPTPHRRRPRSAHGPAPAAQADWCGVQPNDIARLIATYTERGDLVIDLDEHPTIASAARFLGRQPVHLVTDADHRRARPAPPARRIFGRPRTGLILARLPRTGAYSLDLHGMTHAMHTWRSLLRPGGYLLAALTAHGLTWQQEFLVPLVPLPEHEPRAMPDTAGTPAAALVDGRHQPTHHKLLAFQRRVGGSDA